MNLLITMLLASLAIIMMCSAHAEYVLEEERRTDWQPGLVGGLGGAEGVEVSVLDYGADPTGEADSSRAFSLAIAGLRGLPGVVKVPAGDYLLNTTLTVSRDDVVIRGEGPRRSRLMSNVDGVSVNVAGRSIGNWQPVLSGYGKGSTLIGVADGSLFAQVKFVEIQQENDAALMYTKPEWKTSWAENSVGQMVELAGVEGNQLRLKRPLHYGFRSGLNPVVRGVAMVRGVGFEDLYIEKLKANNHTFVFTRVAYSWLHNVESFRTRRSHVKMTAALGMEIRRCFFHDSFSHGNGGSGYGVECSFHTTDVLVVDNEFDALRHAMMVQTGANGNVFAYNFSNNPIQGEPGGPYNSGWIPPDISVHGHYPFMNLFEGNVVHEIGISDYWGPVGPGNTYFRNRVIGDGILYYDSSHGQNVIGNVTTAIRNTDGTSLRLLEHGNIINGREPIWDPAIPERELPASLWLQQRPDFWGNLDWPAIGPDVPANRPIPAQIRFERRGDWAGFHRDGDGMVDTTGLLGWLYAADDSGWAWSFAFASYLFIPANSLSSAGGWVYLAH